jgi:hypothetical protein
MIAAGPIAGAPIASAPLGLWATFAGRAGYVATESDDVSIWAATAPYISRLADNPSGQPMLGTLDKLPQFDRSIMSGNGFAGGANSWGNVRLVNTERVYDGLNGNYAIDGREVDFYAGDPSLPFSTFFLIARMLATTISVDGAFVTVGLQDKIFRLNAATQPTVYQGTGGLEGGSELLGKRKEMSLGRVRNITPTLLIAAELVFSVNGGRPVNAISVVRDKGYPLNFVGDYPTPDLLRQAAIPADSFATCIAAGLLRCANPPQQLTCDVFGDASLSGYVETTGAIMRRVNALTQCLADPGEIDVVSFAALDAAQPAPIGYYLSADSAETVRDTFDRLTRGIKASYLFTLLGMLQCSVFAAPGGAPAQTFTDHEINTEIEVEALPSGFDPPPQRVRCAWDRNWTQIADPVAGAAVVDADLAAWIKTPYRVASTSDASAAAVLEDHLQAGDPAVCETFFALKADADAFCLAQWTLANSGFRLYRVPLKFPPFTLDLCQAVRIVSDQLQFTAGKLCRVAAISDMPGDNAIEIRVLA